MSTAVCPICERPAAPGRRYCETCDFQARPVRADGGARQHARTPATSGNRFAEVRIFLGVFVVAAITTTVLGLGGTLGFSGIRQSLGLLPIEELRQADWGELRWVHVTSRVRSARTTESEVVARLEPGDSVRVDFAGAGWYAVFPAAAADRMEDTAVGYVFGELLKEERPPDVTVPLVRILP